jgi:hypothetical protein
MVVALMMFLASERLMFELAVNFPAKKIGRVVSPAIFFDILVE